MLGYGAVNRRKKSGGGRVFFFYELRTTKVMHVFTEVCVLRYRNVKCITLYAIIKKRPRFSCVISERGLRSSLRSKAEFEDLRYNGEMGG